MKKSLRTLVEEGFGKIGILESKVNGGFGRVANLEKTVKKLAATMQQGFQRIDQRMDRGFIKVHEDHEELAKMVKQGFDDMDERIDQRFSHVDQRFDTVDAEIGAINRRLAQAVYQNEFVALESRVTTLERRTGLSKK
ncbi:MAG: hypothetical protein HYY50_01335 [Candidatus Kerfeldbacteria bacterium]|nr:hypothetical protein [Candidatus Kerfeldbacteria bacterium]